jgi:hypothetical protein
MNTTTSRRAAGPASSALVDNLDRLGVLMTADVPRLTVPVPTTHAEANAVWADYMALRRAAGVMRGQRLHGAAQQLDDVANVLKYRHDQWTKAERDAARERISTSREGN